MLYSPFHFIFIGALGNQKGGCHRPHLLMKEWSPKEIKGLTKGTEQSGTLGDRKYGQQPRHPSICNVVHPPVHCSEKKWSLSTYAEVDAFRQAAFLDVSSCITKACAGFTRMTTKCSKALCGTAHKNIIKRRRRVWNVLRNWKTHHLTWNFSSLLSGLFPWRELTYNCVCGKYSHSSPTLMACFMRPGENGSVLE